MLTEISWYTMCMKLCTRCAILALATVAVLGAVSFAHAQVTCTGLGDNRITLDGGGGVSVACSKYETPGGGATQFAMPDGTMCSFENTNSSQVACGSSKGGKPPKVMSQGEFGDLVRSVQDAYKGGSTHNDVAQIIHSTLLGKQTVADAGIFGDAFANSREGDIASVKTTADQMESVYNALLSLTQESPKTHGGEGVSRDTPALLAVISDTRQWVLTDRPLEEVLGQKKRLANAQNLPQFISSFSDFGSTQSTRNAPQCDVTCALRRAWLRGDVGWVDVLFPLVSAALAGLFSYVARRFSALV